VRIIDFLTKDPHELLEIYEDRLLKKREDEDVEDDVDEFLKKHSANFAQYQLLKFVIKNFLDPIIKKIPPEQLLKLTDPNFIVCKQLFEHPRFSGLVRWIASIGRKIVRKDWGDEKTEEVVFRYFRKFRRELDILTDEELRAWIRRELDWIRENVLGTERVEAINSKLKELLR